MPFIHSLRDGCIKITPLSNQNYISRSYLKCLSAWHWEDTENARKLKSVIWNLNIFENVTYFWITCFFTYFEYLKHLRYNSKKTLHILNSECPLKFKVHAVGCQFLIPFLMQYVKFHLQFLLLSIKVPIEQWPPPPNLIFIIIQNKKGIFFIA